LDTQKTGFTKVIYQQTASALSPETDLVRNALDENADRLADRSRKREYSPLWWFAKTLKGTWHRLSAGTAADRVEKALAEIYRMFPDPWEAAFPACEHPREEFCDTWPLITHIGPSILAEAWRMAQECSIAYLFELRPGTVEAKYADLAFYMEHLSIGDWYTAQVKTAKLLGCERMQVWRAQNALIEKGIICQTGQGFRASKGKGRCARFRFEPDKFAAAAKAIKP
jgi:hypothetical protein